jgi:hypothetical protein
MVSLLEGAAIAFALVGTVAAIVVLFVPKLQYRSTSKRSTPLLVTRWAKHPNGERSTIDYFDTDHNGKQVVKFHQWPHAIVAEDEIDIFKEKGAEDGKGDYVFRFNRDGSEGEWENPFYQDYFARKKRRAKSDYQKFLQKIEFEDYDKYASDVKGAHESDNLDKKFSEVLIKKLDPKPEVVEEKKEEKEEKGK